MQLKHVTNYSIFIILKYNDFNGVRTEIDEHTKRTIVKWKYISASGKELNDIFVYFVDLCAETALEFSWWMHFYVDLNRENGCK